MTSRGPSCPSIAQSILAAASQKALFPGPSCSSGSCPRYAVAKQGRRRFIGSARVCQVNWPGLTVCHSERNMEQILGQPCVLPAGRGGAEFSEACTEGALTRNGAQACSTCLARRGRHGGEALTQSVGMVPHKPRVVRVLKQEEASTVTGENVLCEVIALVILVSCSV